MPAELCGCGEKLPGDHGAAVRERRLYEYLQMRLIYDSTSAEAGFSETLIDLQKMYGTWQVAWGDVNRFQRAAENKFSDEQLSLPLGLTPGTWGSLPSMLPEEQLPKNVMVIQGTVLWQQ